MLWLAVHVPAWASETSPALAGRTADPVDLELGQPGEQTGPEVSAVPNELHLLAGPPPSGTDAKAILVPTAPLLRDALGTQRPLRPLTRGAGGLAECPGRRVAG